jgi:sec-independent protein translocase protein TatB
LFGLGLPEILLILVLALIVLGPKRLPEVAKTIGKAFSEFRRATTDIKDSVENEINRSELEKIYNVDAEDSQSIPEKTPDKIEPQKNEESDNKSENT